MSTVGTRNVGSELVFGRVVTKMEGGGKLILKEVKVHSRFKKKSDICQQAGLGGLQDHLREQTMENMQGCIGCDQGEGGGYSLSTNHQG